MNSNLAGGFVVAVLALALVLGGLGAGVVLSGERAAATTTVTTTKTAVNSTATSPFVVTLVIATGSVFNLTAADQPAFFVLGQHGLQSSANISLPANRLIKLVIVNYDDGNASLNQFGANVVSGTTDGRIFVASNDNINSSQGPTGIVVNGGASVSSVPTDSVAHTFTVPSLNLNIPVPLSSTVVAYFTITRAGNYSWFCITACGDAAMATPGWMRGNLAAS